MPCPLKSEPALCFTLPTLMASHGKTSLNARHSQTGVSEFFFNVKSPFLVKILGLYLHFETDPKHPPDGSEQDQSSGEIYFLNKG